MSYRLSFFAVALVLLIPGSIRAQVKPVNTNQPAQEAEGTARALTPRQAAEIHADILMARKEYASAATAYEDILLFDQKNAVLLNKVGVAYQQLDNLNKAERYYKKAMHADKNFSSAINNCGTVEYERQHFGKAISLYRKALVFPKDTATIYSNLGYAYFSNREYVLAMETFQKALALDPGIFEAKGGNGSVVQQKTATDPGLFYFFVAKAYANGGDAERAAHYLKLSRDDGYNEFLSAQTDPAFARVIKDPRVQEVLQVPPSYAAATKRQNSN
jgi:tetratricopeptide (TPR) repeat protein